MSMFFSLFRNQILKPQYMPSTRGLRILKWVWSSTLQVPFYRGKRKCAALDISDIWRRLSRGYNRHCPKSWTPASRSSFPHPISLQCMVWCCSHTGATSRAQPWERSVFLRPSGLFTWLNPIKAYIETQHSSRWVGRDVSSSGCPRQASYVSSLIKIATCQPGVICVVLQSPLPSRHGGQFQMSPREPQRLQQALSYMYLSNVVTHMSKEIT